MKTIYLSEIREILQEVELEEAIAINKTKMYDQIK